MLFVLVDGAGVLHLSASTSNLVFHAWGWLAGACAVTSLGYRKSILVRLRRDLDLYFDTKSWREG